MAIKLKAIQNLLVKKKSDSSLETIILEYATLKQRIDHPDNQSWYFKQGMKSSLERLSFLNIDFEKIRKSFNESTIDDFIQKINENSLKTTTCEGKYMGTIKLMHYSAMIGESKFLSELIRLKSKTELLMPIAYYLENPDEFLVFLE